MTLVDIHPYILLVRIHTLWVIYIGTLVFSINLFILENVKIKIGMERWSNEADY